MRAAVRKVFNWLTCASVMLTDTEEMCNLRRNGSVVEV